MDCRNCKDTSGTPALEVLGKRASVVVDLGLNAAVNLDLLHPLTLNKKNMLIFIHILRLNIRPVLFS